MVLQENLADICSTVDAFYKKYDPKEVLGKGVSSVVRRCVEREGKREFAVKIIDLNAGEHNYAPQELRDMAMKEIEVLYRVHDHENIMMLADVYETEAHIFIVTELCSGGELFNYITTLVTLSEKRTRIIMRQVFSALEHMHSRGIVHRDIKLENILFNDLENLSVRIADFGFAIVVESDTELFSGMGTLGYLAPEILLVVNSQTNVGYGRPVDLWAAGVVMFNLLSGSAPFVQCRRMFQHIREGRYNFDAPAWESVSDTAKDLVRRLMEVEPTRRLTAKEALEHDFFAQLDVQGGVVPLGDTTIKFSPRCSWRRALLAVLTLVRLDQMRRVQRPARLSDFSQQPYLQRRTRKLIDNVAFLIYNHWVKKGEEQNRTALFQNVILAESIDLDDVDAGGDVTPTKEGKGKDASHW